MPSESIRVSGVIPAAPERIYGAWLSAKEHGSMTGGAAEVEPFVGGRFTAWDTYIEGETLELSPGRRIVQTWRTTEFPEGSPASLLEILLEPSSGGTTVTFIHTGIPEGQGARYEEGWNAYYLEPMRRYFGKASLKKAAPPAGKSSAKKAAPPARKISAKKAAPPARKTSAKKAAPRPASKRG